MGAYLYLAFALVYSIWTLTIVIKNNVKIKYITDTKKITILSTINYLLLLGMLIADGYAMYIILKK